MRALWPGPGVVVSWLLLAVVAFLPRPGQTTFDTKYDLVAAPGAGLDGFWRFWDPAVNFGSIGNQDYGYLFPQGAWFWIFEQAQVPDWIAQRLWTFALLVCAFEGTRRIAGLLGSSDDGPHLSSNTRHLGVLAGLAFALSPRLFGLAGVLSAEVLPTAVLPWVCLPLLLTHRGRISACRGGLLSGLAVLGMGGVNAVENLAALPLPLLIVMGGLGSVTGRRLARWWVLTTAAVSLWWMLPLFVMARYSPPFLDYIETSFATTRTTGWSNSLRGAEHWLNYIWVGDHAFWPAANALSITPWLMFVGGSVTALGLVGLFWCRWPGQAAFRLSFLLGIGLLVVGHGGIAGSPLAPWIREVLDGSLAAFRNVHKVDPLVRLPLALGVAAAAEAATQWLAAGAAKRDQRSWRHGLEVPAYAVALGLVLLSALPAATHPLRHPGWEQLPDGWVEAADWLKGERGTTLVVPATAFGMQRWGWTVDEPIQALATQPWAARSQIPLVPPATIRWMDSIEQRLETGTGSAALADTLASAGVQRLLVRRDIDLGAADVADPNRVDLALANSPGISWERSFGRSGFGDQALIDIYRVEAPSFAVSAQLARSVPTIYGGPEDVFTAREAGALGPATHALVGPFEDPDIQADGYRLHERQFGRFHDAVSEVMVPGDPSRLKRVQPDYAGVPGVERVSAGFRGVATVRASSSSGYADTLGPIRAENGPSSVADGDESTFWRSALFAEPVGEWVELRLNRARPIGLVRVVAGVDGFSGSPVRTVRVRAADREEVVSVDPKSGRAVVDLGGVRADRVRVTIASVVPGQEASYVALREIAIDGVASTRYLAMPEVQAGSDTSFVFSAQAPRRACTRSLLGTQCSALGFAPSDEQTGLRREFDTVEAGQWHASGQVIAMPSPETLSLFTPLKGSPGMRAKAESVFGSDPAASAQFAVDGDPGTPWLTNVGVHTAVLKLNWPRTRELTRLLVSAAPVDSLRPTTALISTSTEQRTVSIGAGGWGYFPALKAKRVRIEFSTPGRDENLPMGIGDVTLVGAEDLAQGIDTTNPTGAVCGFGPEVMVDGQRVPTRVSGTMGDILDGRPLSWEACGTADLFLQAGTHRLVTKATPQFVPVRLRLGPAAGATSSAPEKPEERGLTVINSSGIRLLLRIAEGEEALLSFGQNANPGWQATVDGDPLEPVTIDGWQQGFRLPAGGSVMVEIRYVPETSYLNALLVAAVAIGLMLLLLIRDLVLPTARSAPIERLSLDHAEIGLLTALGAVLLGPLWLVSVLGGALLARRRPGRVTAVAILLGILSAVLAIYSAQRVAGLPSPAADAAAAVGVGLLVGVWCRDAWAAAAAKKSETVGVVR